MLKRDLCPIVAAALVLQLGGPAYAWQSSHWAEGFDGGVLGVCNTMVVHDAGAGSELYAFAPWATSSSVTYRFDGTMWRHGAQANAPVVAATTFGPIGSTQLIAASGASAVQSLSNGAWSTIGTAFQLAPNAATTLAIVAWNDGSGPAVYVAGRFTSINSVPASNIARWDGTTWSALGSGLDGAVQSLTVYDDGGGPALYAGGSFSNAGASPAPGVARWRNGAWTALPGTGPGTYLALQAFDDGTGPELYAGGTFTLAGNPTNLAVWSGSNWFPVGAVGQVSALAVHDDGGGPALFASDKPPGSGFQPAQLRRLRSGNWTPLPLPSATIVTRMLTFQGRLWLGGTFSALTEVGFSSVQSWDGTSFRSAFMGNGTNGPVAGLRVLDDGSGPRLHAGGAFRRAGRTPAKAVATFDGTTWSNLGAGVDSYVTTFEQFDDGTGTKLYAGGNTSPIGSLVRSWNGTSWSTLGNGPGVGVLGDIVYALQAFDDGSGPQLYAGGVFTVPAGSTISNIARWNGSTWSPVGSGFGQPGDSNGQVNSLVVFDEGAGPRLFAGGLFTLSGATTVNGIARWNGTSWTPVGGGLDVHYPGGVSCMLVFDDGSGAKLYAGGSFDPVGLGKVARWDGTSWTAVGTGLPNSVSALCVHDDGSGPKLYAGINNFPAISTPGGLYRFDGVSWTAIPGAPNMRSGERIIGLASYDDPSPGPAALYATGIFEGGETVSSHIAKWSSETEDVLVCRGDGSDTACPCGNASAAAQAAGCLNSLGLAGTLRTSGAASVSNDSLVLLGTSMTNNGAALYFQGTTAVNLGAGSVFGDGLRCAGGTVRRLATVMNSAGASQVPGPTHPTAVSIAGSIPAGGATRVYQAWYRNAASFCTAATWNLTNGVRITWRP